MELPLALLYISSPSVSKYSTPSSIEENISSRRFFSCSTVSILFLISWFILLNARVSSPISSLLRTFKGLYLPWEVLYAAVFNLVSGWVILLSNKNAKIVVPMISIPVVMNMIIVMALIDWFTASRSRYFIILISSSKYLVRFEVLIIYMLSYKSSSMNVDSVSPSMLILLYISSSIADNGKTDSSS